MRIPLTFFAVPPLLLLYPLSTLLSAYRHFAAHSSETLTLLTPDGVVDPLAASPVLAEKVAIALAEDAVLHAGHGAAILSTDPGRGVFNPFTGEGDAAAAPGGVLVWYDVRAGTQRPLAVAGWPAGRALHPLGLGLRGDVLAVVNMVSPPGVEILELDAAGGAARWVRTLAHARVPAPNAVAVLSAHQVLVSNSFRWPARTHPWLNRAETLLGLPLGRVFLLTAQQSEGGATATAEPVSEGLALANGLALSADGRVLLAAASVAQEVQVYDVAPPALGPGPAAPGAFTYRETLPVGFTVDNVRFVSSSGGADGGNYTFLAAGHPSAFAYLATAAARGAGALSGSVAAKLTVAGAGAGARDTAQQARAEVNRLFARVDSRVRTVMQDSGAFIGTASTALPLGTGTGDEGGGEGSDMLVCGLWDRGVARFRDVDLRPVQL